MNNVDPAVQRIISALSKALDTPLELCDADGESETVVASPVAFHRRIAIRRNDDRPFRPSERDLLAEILAFVGGHLTTRSEVQALEQRLRLVERENVELVMKNRALAEISSRDALTGLYTRWFVLDKIEAEISRSLRHGSPMSVLMLDIDHFKQINDSFGHPIGDRVLHAVGQVVKESCRIYDVPGRYGGEEFCLLLPETRLDGTLPVAERIRRRVEASPLLHDGVSVNITASVGVAGLESVPDEAIFSAAALIDRADRALYHAKERGRNRTEVWSVSFINRPLLDQ